MVIVVNNGVSVEFEGYVFVGLADNLDARNHAFEWKLVGHWFARSKEGGISHRLAGGGIGDCCADDRFLSTVVLGDEQVDVCLLDSDEVVDMGVPYENLQKPLILEKKFEVVTGTVFSQFDENSPVWRGMIMSVGLGMPMPVMILSAGSKRKCETKDGCWEKFHDDPFTRPYGFGQAQEANPNL